MQHTEVSIMYYKEEGDQNQYIFILTIYYFMIGK